VTLDAQVCDELRGELVNGLEVVFFCLTRMFSDLTALGILLANLSVFFATLFDGSCESLLRVLESGCLLCPS